MAESEAEAIEWYKHYMNIQIQDLVAEYIACSVRDNRELTPAMEAAMEDRMDEMETFRANES